ncbi:MAG: hypothetical protein IAE94_07735 [Chthoniobacterales bacterium]|nr:hypothetical protein [Chthoniobacterales bacterium]
MKTKAELLANVARSRAAIKRDTAAVRAELDVLAKLQNSVRSRPFAWLGGAAAIGYIFAGPKTRTKTVTKYLKGKPGEPLHGKKRKPRGWLAIAFAFFKVVFPWVRRALSAYATKRVGDFASRLVR